MPQANIEKRYNSNRRDITRFTLFGQPRTADIPPGYEQIVAGTAQAGDLTYRADTSDFRPAADHLGVYGLGTRVYGLGTRADFYYCLIRKRKAKEDPDG